MRDTTFQWSLIILSFMVLLWIVLGSIYLFGVFWSIVTGLIIWIIGGGMLLYYWGKNYMSRL